MAAHTQDWICIPYGPDNRKQREALVGSEWDPANKKYGLDWNKLRCYGLSVNGYGYNGIYLDTYKLPDNRILVERTDKYSCVSRFLLFDSVQDYEMWVKNHNQTHQEIDPETGRPFRK